MPPVRSSYATTHIRQAKGASVGVDAVVVLITRKRESII
jgi:hypothetical protein